ncbi:MAG: M20/M25/M40 family metallo-hydrolase [Archangium sp.]
MRSFRAALVSSFTFVSCATSGLKQQAPIPPYELTQLQGATTQSAELATSLCDTAGARFSGSPGETRAVAWAVETMKRLGFSNVHTEPVTVPHWVRGRESARIVAPYEQTLSVVGLGHSTSTPEGGVEGEVVEVESLDALDAIKPGSLTGKILFVNVPMRRAVDGSGYGAVARIRRLGGMQALAGGAVASLIRSVGTDQNRLGHTGSQGPDPAKIPSGALATTDADLLHRLLKNGPVKLSLTLLSREEPPVESANVVGEIPGREKPEEVVLLGAHLDSWDLGTGAIDDGAGVGIVLDVARLMTTLQRAPKRTVRVVLFANEESGLAGGKAYAKAHETELEKIVIGIEADSGTDKARATRILASDAAREKFLTWAPWLVPLDVRVEQDHAEGGADLSVLRAAGVPVLDVRQDASRYFDFHHTANDTVDKIDSAQIAQATRAYACMAWLAAEQDVDFGRVAADSRERKK